MSDKLRIMNDKLKTKFGFTLIELLVTIFITVLLVTLFIPQYRSYSQRNALKLAVQEMKEKILLTQSLAYAPQDKKQSSEKNPTKPYTYYRFVFYPDNPEGIKYEIKVGDYDKLEQTPISLNNADNYEKVIESGILAKTITYSGSASSLNRIDNFKQGTVVFQMISGKCDFWHTSSQSPLIFEFTNEKGDKATLEINLETCAVNVRS